MPTLRTPTKVDYLNMPPEETGVVTNKVLVERPDPAFILSATIHHHQGEIGEINVVIPPANKAVIVSESMQATLSSGEHGHSIAYFSRSDVQTASDEKSVIPADYRVLRIMPVLTLSHGDRELIPLTLRGKGASNKGSWGCASSLASKAIDTNSLYEALNIETGILVDGRPVILVPDADVNAKAIEQQAIDAKKRLVSKVPELKTAFNSGMEPLIVSATMNLPEKSNTVNIHGGTMNDQIQCLAYDNPSQRTLTLVFPISAKLPADSALTVFNGEGYSGPATLVTKGDLKNSGEGMKLIPGLKDYIMGA